MFSGKSEELIRRLRRAEIAGQRALIVKPRIDDRYDVGHVVTHAGREDAGRHRGDERRVRRLAAGYDAVGIDEVQFFDDDIVDAIDALVARGARVVAAGLAQDFRGSRSARCRRCSASRSSSTSWRRSATAAAARRR